MKKALVLGAGGFIGTHLVFRLKQDGYFVRGIDLKYPEFSKSDANEFIIADLRDPTLCNWLFQDGFDECYQLAADMGGAEFVFTKEHDADIFHNSALININVAYYAAKWAIKKLFFSSSACVYPEVNQMDPDMPVTREASAYPADPDSEYGWEKIMSERLYQSYEHNYKIDVRIARFHNIYGPLGTFHGGREKAPAALCRKIIEAPENGSVEILGDGQQTRSFLYIDQCIEGIRRLMESDFHGPVNIGSDEMVSIKQLAEMILEISGREDLTWKFKKINAPVGVRGRTSDNRLIKEKLGWEPSYPLHDGLVTTYNWIKELMDGWQYIYEYNPDTNKTRKRRIKPI